MVDSIPAAYGSDSGWQSRYQPPDIADQPISLDTTTPVEDTPIQLPVPGNTGNPVPPDTAANRAFKIQYGLTPLGDKYGNYNQIYNRLIGGEEGDLRNEAATDTNLQNGQKATDYLSQVAGSQIAPLAPETSAAIIDKFNGIRQPVDPDTVVEQAFGKAYIDTLHTAQANNPGSVLDDAWTHVPLQTQALYDLGSETTAKFQYVNTRLENLQNSVKNQSYVDYGVDFLLAPALQDILLRGQSPNVGVLDGYLTGHNIELQRKDLFRLPLPQFTAKMGAILDHLEKISPNLALTFANYMHGMSTSDVFDANANNIMNLTGVAGFGVKGVSQIREANQLFKDTKRVVDSIVQAGAKDPKLTYTAPLQLTYSTALEAAGDVKEAGIQKAATNVLADAQGTTNPTKRSIEALTSNLRLDLEEQKSAPGVHGQSIVNKLEEQTNSTIINLEKTLQNARVNRTPQLASADVMRAVLEASKDQYPGLRNNIMDAGYGGFDPVTNTHQTYLDVAPNDGLFLTPASAEAFAKVNGILDYELKDEGIGYFLRLHKPLDENQFAIKDGAIETHINKRAGSAVTKFLDFLGNPQTYFNKGRTADESLSEQQKAARAVATHGPSNFIQVVRSVMGDIDKLKNRDTLRSTNNWKDLERTLNMAKDATDPLTGLKGYFYGSPLELENFYQNTFKRMPEELETTAYFAYKRAMEVDRMFRELSEYTKRSTVGAEQHNIVTQDENLRRKESGFFDGVTRNKVPSGDDLLMYITDRADSGQALWADKISQSSRNRLQKLVDDGQVKVIELYKPSDYPLAKLGEAGNFTVRYVIAPNVETKALEFNHVPRRGGGHFELDYDHYIKQADVRKETVDGKLRALYLGDNTVMPIETRALGKDIAAKLDKVRQALADKNSALARSYAKDLPINFKELQSWFNPSKNPVTGEINPPRLNLHEPIQVVPKNTLISKMSGDLRSRYDLPGKAEVFKDGTKSGSLANLNEVEFTKQRDSFEIKTIRDYGGVDNPVYTLEPAKLVDPIPSMNRGLNRIINSTFIDDYKSFAMDHWLRKAEQYLDVRHLSEIRESPYFYFNNANDHWLKGMDPKIKSQLMAENWQIRQFTGTTNETKNALNSIVSYLQDSVYKTYGPSKVKYVPDELIPKLKDPIAFLRSMAFQKTMGLFNVPQIFSQLNGVVSIAGIAGPQHAIPGMAAATYHIYTRLNRNAAILDKLDESMSKLNIPGAVRWKRGEWKEAFDLLMESGFQNVGKEYALVSDPYNQNVVSTLWGKFLDAGTIFFKGGEATVRYASWYTAYKEFRTLNPLKTITRDDQASILERANLLNGNMTHASNSMFQTGVLSPMSQFYTWQQHQADLMLGKRLTGTEKARLFATYAAFYGLPTAAGVTGIPLADILKKYAQDNNYVVGEKYWSSLINEGIPSFMGAMITGKGDPKAGNWYNFGDRWGTQGYEPIREALRGDQPWWKIFGGAAISSAASAFEATDGFRAAMGSMMRRGKDDRIPLKWEDILIAGREIASVNNAWRTMVAIHSGDWLSKNEKLTDKNISPANAIFMGITGLQPQGVGDAYNKIWSMKQDKDMQTEVEKQFMLDYGRAVRAMRDNNPDQATDFMKRAMAKLEVSGYPDELRSRLFSRAEKSNETLIDSVNWNYYLRNIPSKKADAKADAYSKQLNIDNQKQGTVTVRPTPQNIRNGE